jgi:flagellar basal-body rod modification protein FlgD
MATAIETQNAAFVAAVNSGNPPPSSASSASQGQLTSDINTFLKLFTEQLKNQDPSAPLDSNEFTQQIAQYSSVQQQVNTNSNLEKLLAANQQTIASTAVGYIGREVETAGNTGVVLGGQGAFSYILPSNANSVEITLTDADGQVVFRGNGDTKSGRNVVVWDGINSTTGLQEPDGTYKIAVLALDPAGKPISVETRAVATVVGVETDTSGNTLLSVDSGTVNFNDVLAVRPISRVSISTNTAPPTDTSSSGDASS